MKKICPECGYEDASGNCEVCPECGCPLSENSIVDDAAAEGENNKTIAQSTANLQAEVNNDGCIDSWSKHNKSEAALPNILDWLSTIIGWTAIILTIIAVIYLIVKGCTTDGNLEMYILFRSQAYAFIIPIICLFSVNKIMETVAYFMELKLCTKWLCAHGLDTVDCLELKRYGKTKKTSVFFSLHNIEVAYCGVHPDHVVTVNTLEIIKCVIYVVSTVLFGLFCFPVIGQYILDMPNAYVFYGFLAGAVAAKFLHWIVCHFIDKDFYAKTDEWLKSKNKR